MAALRNTSTRFGSVAKLLHWSLAALLIGLLGLGLYMHDLPISPNKFELYALHKSLGVTALGLALLRLGWRAVDPPPGALPSTPKTQIKLAKLAHSALYVCMVALPLTGWAMAAASGTPVDYFNTGILLPNLVDADNDLRTTFRTLHDIIGKLLIALILLHAGAALKHHFIDRDATLHRMLPWGRVRD